MKTIIKRLSGLLLCICLLTGTVQIGVFADEVTLADSATDNIIRADELTFLGNDLKTLEPDDLEEILLANGYHPAREGSNIYQKGDSRPYYYINPTTSNGNALWGFAAGGYSIVGQHKEIGDEAAPIGLRDITTMDAVETVLSKLGFSNENAIAAQLRSLLNHADYSSEEEAHQAWDNLSELMGDRYEYCDQNVYIQIACDLHGDPSPYESYYLNYSIYFQFSTLPDYRFCLGFDYDFQYVRSISCSLLSSASSLPSLPFAVKFIPYSATLPRSWNPVEGSLPAWLSAEGTTLSGVPTEAGSFSLCVTLGQIHKSARFLTLTVRENGDSSVRASISEGYQIVEDMPDIAAPTDVTIVIDDLLPSTGSDDNFSRLQDVYLNGRRLNGGKLTPDQAISAEWEYYAERGSSRITVREQTLAAEGTGTSTIAVTYASSSGSSGGTDVVSMNYTNYTFDPVRESDYIFSDAAQTLYRDAIKLLSFMGHVDGFEDGTFRPKDSLTRAQAAKLLASVLGEGDAQGTAPFADTRGHWAEHFIALCAARGIVSGVNDTEYAPNVPLTGYAWAKMLFCAKGFDAQAYGLDGANWQNNVMELIYQYGIDRDMSHFKPSAEISREEACQLLYNAFIRNLLP